MPEKYERPTIVVATTTQSCHAVADRLQAAVEQTFGGGAKRQDMPMLAGPNDAIQLLLDASNWFALGGGAWLAQKLGDKAFDAGWDKIVEKGRRWFKDSPEPLSEKEAEPLVGIIIRETEAAQAARNSLVLGLPTSFRNIGVELPLIEGENTGDARKRVLRIIQQLGVGAGAIEKFLADYPKFRPAHDTGQNSDCSTRIRLALNGELKLRITDEAGKLFDVAFSPDGYRIEDAPPDPWMGDDGTVYGLPEDR